MIQPSLSSADVHDAQGHQEHIRKLLSPDKQEERISLIRVAMLRSMAVIIPTYPNQGRLETIQHSLNSMQGQAETINRVRVYIPYNGNPEHPHRNQLEQLIDQFHGRLHVRILDATPENDLQKSPAFSRNTAVAGVFGLAEDHPELRPDVFYFHDDDSAISADALAQLNRAISSRDDIVAASPQVKLVSKLQQAEYGVHGQDNSAPYLLPSVWRGGEVDIMGLIAMSSDVTTRTSASLVRADSLRKLGSTPFVAMPNKSGEDIIFGTAITRNGGKIVRVPGAISFDKMRDRKEEVRKQKAPWGVDHVHLANNLINIGILRPRGTHVLLPSPGSWQEAVLPEVDGNSAYIINPAQLLRVTRLIKDEVDCSGFENFMACFQSILPETLDPTALDSELASLENRLETILHRLTAERVPTEDHPFMFDGMESRSNPRQSDDSQVAQLMGNIIGNVTLRAKHERVTAFYGLRQHAHVVSAPHHV